MAYVGNSPVSGPARPLHGTGTGDGTTTVFAMGFSPQTVNHVQVLIDGHEQEPTTAYTVSGSNCTFTSAPMNGEHIDFKGHEVGKDTVPQDNSIDQSKVNTGSITPIVQIQYSIDGVMATGTTVLPFDNTTPQITEGDEYMTVSITPTSATSLLKIDVVALASTDDAAGSRVTTALFQDSTANALASMSYAVNTATREIPISFSHIMVAGTTSATTFRVRIGSSSANTTTFNGSSGTAYLNGTLASSIIVTEIMQ